MQTCIHPQPTETVINLVPSITSFSSTVMEHELSSSSATSTKTNNQKDKYSTTHSNESSISVLNLNRELLFSSAIAKSVGLDPQTHAILEIPNGSSSLYNSMLQYAANFAVDIDHPLPAISSEIDPSSPSPLSETKNSIDSSAHAPSIPSKDEEYFQDYDLASQFPEITRGSNGVNVPRREGPGRLSSLWNCPEDRCDPLTFSDSDSEIDSVTEETISAAINGVGVSNSDGSLDGSTDELNCNHSIGALRKRIEPPIQRYQMGIGYAKVLIGSNVIYIHHCAFGLPISESFSVQVFRTIALAAEDAFHLKELCAVVLKWRSDREQRNQRAKAGRFTLFRWKTNGSGCGDWINQGYKRSRPPKSVILPDGQLEAIIRDIKEFVARDTKTWYEAHGLPHRRSYLFHGPPGSGKSSTIKMIAGMFRLNACFLGLTAGDFSNQVLQDALSTMPRRALLVLEDVDVLFNEERKSESSQSLTFSGMLNALDGLISVDGVITIFTTNHIEKLDPALVRGGRVDRRFEFIHPNTKQLSALFKSFYEDASSELANKFAEIVLSRPEQEARSIATLQQHFIYTRKMSAEQSVQMIPKFFTEFYPNGGQSRNPLYI